MRPMRHRLFAAALVMVLACDDKTPPPPAATPVTPSATVTASAEASVSPSASARADEAPPESIAAQHVLIAYKGAKNAPSSVKRSKAEAKARAEEVSTKAKAGADFTALVATYTDDESTRSRQGNLGKFTRAKMLPAFADAAFALGVDEISAPVETVHGYHVIKRNQ